MTLRPGRSQERASGSAPRLEPVPTVALSQPGPVPGAVLNGHSMVAEEFRVLRAKLRALDSERAFRCIGLVSSGPGEGKSTICLGLVAALAQEPDTRVLLIDVDMRKSSLESYLGISRAPGLREWLSVPTDTIPVRKIPNHGFTLLSAGLNGDARPELLGSERMATLLAEARRTYDFVILDCPPLVPVADSVILQDLVDGFLFVVRARHTPRETISKALSHLKPDRVRGTVFNDHRDVLPGYQSYGYRQYGSYR